MYLFENFQCSSVTQTQKNVASVSVFSSLVTVFSSLIEYDCQLATKNMEFQDKITVFKMNTGETKNSSKEQRMQAINNILNDESPTLVFVQDFPLKGLHQGVFKDFIIPKHYEYKYYGNDHSGFICDARYIDCQRLDFKTSVRCTYGRLIALHSSEAYFDLSRLCLCKIKGKGCAEFEILCASWHKPYNESGPKEKHIRPLLKFLSKIKAECGDLPFMLGGDFNFERSAIDKIPEDLSSNLVVKYLPKTPKTPDSIMQWVLSDDFKQTLNVLKEYKKDFAEFGHVSLAMELKLFTTTEVLKLSIPRPQKVEKKQMQNVTDWFDYELYGVKETNEQEMISVSWHGAYGEYSEEAKIKSLKGTLQFLLLEYLNYFKIKPIPNDVELNLKWVLNDAVIKENIHSHENILDSWVLISNKELLSQEHKDKKWESIELVLSQSTPQRLQGFKSATPVDIHLDIVNMYLCRHDGGKIFVGGYLKRCIYLQ